MSIAPYIRYLHLNGAGVRCDAVPTLRYTDVEVFTVQPDLISLISALPNLEALSHQMPIYGALRLTAPYMLALMTSSIKHVALRGILCSSEEVYRLQSEGDFSWPAETLIIKVHWQIPHGHPDTIVPSVLITSCSKTLTRLTLDSWSAMAFFTEPGNSFPALHTVHLDPTPGRIPSPAPVIHGHPVLSTLYSTIACRVESIPILRRYTSSTYANGELLIDNLKRNSQLESISILADDEEYFHDIFATKLINTICQMPQLRSLSLEGEMSGGMCVDALQSIASISTLQNLQLWGPLVWLELYECMVSGNMQALQWLSIGDDLAHEYDLDWTMMTFPPHVLERVRTYRTLFTAELFAAALPSLQGCLFGAIPIEIINGKAHALLARPCSEKEMNQLWDHSMTTTDTHLWHWD